MEFPFAPLLAFNPLEPIIAALHGLLGSIDGVVHNYGWSLIVLALLIKLAFWPLNTMQFKAMLKTQAIAPKLKALQARHKNDKERLNTETMALYKESGANPAAGCLPLLLQMPIIWSLYQAVLRDSKTFANQTWLWIGSKVADASPIVWHRPIPHHAPLHVLAPSLADPDFVLLALYIVSMYLSIRFTSPAIDPAQAQQQKMMAIISPVMIGYIGYQYAWPSALILYWLAFNVFSTGQQLYLINRYHRNPAAIGPHPETVPSGAGTAPALENPKVVAKAATSNGSGKSGSRSARRRRSRR